MRIFFTLRNSWNRISDWVPIVFHFGTENWEEQLKKTPCTNLLASFNIQENIEDIIDHEMKFYVYDDPYLLTSFNIPENAGHVAAGCEDLIVVKEPKKI